MRAILALFMVICVLFPGSALAERRVAFVLGNSVYDHAPALANPGQDTELLARTLAALSFEVTRHHDLTVREIGGALTTFLLETEDADITLFYFAGHGMQFDGKNYLLGRDSRFQTLFDVRASALELDAVVAALEANSRAALIFVDACRNNPIADAFFREQPAATRSLTTRGLAPMESAFEGTMITFAASPGQVAYDGIEAANSPFAQALARHLPTANMEVLSLMKRVIRDVRDQTGGLQTPMVTNDLTAEIYLASAVPPAPGASVPAPVTAADLDFAAAEALDTVRGWQLFLQAHPNSPYRAEAIKTQEQAFQRDMRYATLRSRTEGIAVTISQAAGEEAEAALGIDRDDILAVQALLAREGYDTGGLDGALGPRSRQALAAFQADAGLAANGFISPATADALGLRLIADRISYSSGPMTRRFDAEMAARLEDDPRLIAALRGLQGRRLIYGYLGDRLYIATHREAYGMTAARNVARQAGGYLASISSAAENTFLYRLTRADNFLWQYHAGSGRTWGPIFGLSRGGTSGSGGWGWENGEPIRYTNWAPGEPGRSPTQSIAAFYHPPGAPSPDGRTAPTWANQPLSFGMLIEIE